MFVGSVNVSSGEFEDFVECVNPCGSFTCYYYKGMIEINFTDDADLEKADKWYYALYPQFIRINKKNVALVYYDDDTNSYAWDSYIDDTRKNGYTSYLEALEAAEEYIDNL